MKVRTQSFWNQTGGGGSHCLFFRGNFFCPFRVWITGFCPPGNCKGMPILAGMQWCSWMRHCIASWKVMVSILSYIYGIFHQHNTSGCTLALILTQPLTKMSNMNTSRGVKAGSA